MRNKNIYKQIHIAKKINIIPERKKKKFCRRLVRKEAIVCGVPADDYHKNVVLVLRNVHSTHHDSIG